MESARDHWQNVYGSKSPETVSWYQRHLARSIALVRTTGVAKDAEILDVGGGASTFAGDLLELGYTRVSVLDVSATALETARARLGPAAAGIRWIESDLLEAGIPPSSVDLWHDRALFHFFREKERKEAYARMLAASLRSGGFAIIATFAPDGPVKCSGLGTERYSADALSETLGSGFRLLSAEAESHTTPSGAVQQFQYSLFRKLLSVQPSRTANL